MSSTWRSCCLWFYCRLIIWEIELRCCVSPLAVNYYLRSRQGEWKETTLNQKDEFWEVILNVSVLGKLPEDIIEPTILWFSPPGISFLVNDTTSHPSSSWKPGCHPWPPFLSPLQAWRVTKFCQLYLFNTLFYHLCLLTLKTSPPQSSGHHLLAGILQWSVALLSIPSLGSCPKEYETISLIMLFPNPCHSFALMLFSSTLSFWWTSSYSSLWVSSREGFSWENPLLSPSRSGHSHLSTLRCPEHTSSVHLCPLHWKLFQGQDVFNLQCPNGH